MSSTPKPAATLKRRIESAANVVTEARRAVEAGSQVNLAGLETEVEAICTQLSALPEGAGAALQPALVALVDDLERLTDTLSDAHKKLAGDIGELSTRRRATKAYGQP
jgi:hypothetical protein